MAHVFNEKTVRLRPFEKADIDLLCDYWYRSSREFLESMQVVPEKMLPEEQLRQRWLTALQSNLGNEQLKSAGIVIEVQGDAVGAHLLTEIEFGNHGVFHAHIWRSELRKCGLATYTYPRACKYFMERFHCKKILFKTPIKNQGPNRLKQKMGLAPVGEIEMTVPFVKDGTKAFLYELFPTQLDIILARGCL